MGWHFILYDCYCDYKYKINVIILQLCTFKFWFLGVRAVLLINYLFLKKKCHHTPLLWHCSTVWSLLADIPVFFIFIITLFSLNSQQVPVCAGIRPTHDHHKVSVFVSVLVFACACACVCACTDEVTQGTRAPDGLIGSLLIWWQWNSVSFIFDSDYPQANKRDLTFTLTLGGKGRGDN